MEGKTVRMYITLVRLNMMNVRAGKMVEGIMGEWWRKVKAVTVERHSDIAGREWREVEAVECEAVAV